NVRGDKLEVIRESLRSSKLNTTIETLRTAEALWRTACRRIASASLFLGRAWLVAARVEDEVGITIVKRTVLNHVDHRAIDAASAERNVVADFVFGTERNFPDALGLQTRIQRRGVRAQVCRTSANSRNDE